ncbi:unnamed protein product [Ilex paraguariensis]|uniref:Uncharacterized protein n=1 Tax=Ilex paraguariensis TaxID=185542 RepID=A0ABC8SA90_9AQUA
MPISDKTDLESTHPLVFLSSCHEFCPKIPYAPSNLDLDCLDLVGEFGFNQKKEGGEISKYHGHAELPGSETIIQQKTTPRAQEPTTVDPYATLSKFQLSTNCSLHTEVMTRKTPLSSNNHLTQNKMISKSEITSKKRKASLRKSKKIQLTGII